MKRMKLERMNRSIKAGNLAKKLGITYVYLSKVENGHLEPSVELAEKICIEFNDNSNFSLLDKYPSLKNVKLKDYIEISNDFGYKVNDYLFTDIK